MSSSEFGTKEPVFWKVLFFLLIPVYALYYAPYGINETDGGVFTGLAWQLENGRQLYKNLVYVRPPLTVWLRWLELRLLPENFAMLGERWIFYLKLAAYSGLGAAILEKEKRRWMLASFGFVVAAHNCSPMIWHTVDGVFFAVLGCWLWCNTYGSITHFFSGVCIALAMLCKQSFYPLMFLFPAFTFWVGPSKKAWVSAFGLALSHLLFVSYLAQNQILRPFLSMTSGSTTLAEALQHGLGDYLPEVGIVGLGAMVFGALGRFLPRMQAPAFYLVVFGGMAIFPIRVYLLQETTVPWHESRLFFIISCAAIAYGLIKNQDDPLSVGLRAYAKPLILLSISWCTAISWGYNLPIFFGVPLVWGVVELSRQFTPRAIGFHWKSIASFLFLIIAFGYAHRFVYRDGNRSELTQPMEKVFPRLTGIYSDTATYHRYQELKVLATRYPNFKTVPAFPSAHYLTQTQPPVSIDWLIDEEIGEAKPMVIQSFTQHQPILFVERVYLPGLYTAPRLRLVQELLSQSEELERTPNFIVLRPNYTQFE